MPTQAQIHFGYKELTAPAVEPVTVAEAKTHIGLNTSDADTLIGKLITAARLQAEIITRRVFVASMWRFTLDQFPAGREPIELPKSPLIFVKRVQYVDTDAATQTWGDRTAIWTVTPANVEITDVFDILVGGVTIATFTATDTTVADVTAGLVAAWNASTHDFADGITASDSVTAVTLTSATGQGFKVTTSTTDGGGAGTQTLTAAESQDESTLYTVDDVSTPARLEPIISEDYPDTDQGITNAVIIDLLCGYGGSSSVPENAKIAIAMGAADLFEHREANTEAQLKQNHAFNSLLWGLRIPRVM